MQEEYRDRPWALLVGCILFNMVHGSKARPVLEEFLRRWPTPEELLGAERRGEAFDALVELFRPLGFQTRRTYRIGGMTFDFLRLRPDLNPDIDVTELHGVGKYGADSFNIFCRGYLVEDAKDKELKRYVAWAKGKAAEPEPAGAGAGLREDPRPADPSPAGGQEGERQGEGP